MKPFALQARFVLPLDGHPPINGGIVSISGERITAVGENISGSPPLDLGDVILLPGLVNAHTHLEFSQLTQPLGMPGQSMPEWIRDVLSSRQSADSNPVDQNPEAAIVQGLRESIASGTTSIGEIATQEVAFANYATVGAEVTIFRELLGLPAERVPELTAKADAHLKQLNSFATNLQAGLSPHAPYSVHPDIVRWSAACSNRVPIAMHLAESLEELELLASGTGPFVKLLQERGVWTPESLIPNSRPLDYLKMLSHAQRAMVIHGNYLQTDELEFLAEHRENMTLVYCPRTHDFFGHHGYPIHEALKLGVSLALGTDSRGSNPDLSLLAEMRFVAQRYPDVPPETILQMGTITGAKALGLDKQCGTLKVGKVANLTAISISDDVLTPYEQILQGQGDVRETWCRGKSVFQAN